MIMCLELPFLWNVVELFLRLQTLAGGEDSFCNKLFRESAKHVFDSFWLFNKTWECPYEDRGHLL